MALDDNGANVLRPWAQKTSVQDTGFTVENSAVIETFLSGTGLAREYFLLSQKEFKAEQIAVAEKAGDPYAVRSLATYKDRLARSLAALANDVIVLGGGISNINSLYDELPELFGRHALSDGIRTRVVRAAHGNSSGVRGAAWLWPIEKT